MHSLFGSRCACLWKLQPLAQCPCTRPTHTHVHTLINVQMRLHAHTAAPSSTPRLGWPWPEQRRWSVLHSCSPFPARWRMLKRSSPWVGTTHTARVHSRSHCKRAFASFAVDAGASSPRQGHGDHHQHHRHAVQVRNTSGHGHSGSGAFTLSSALCSLQHMWGRDGGRLLPIPPPTPIHRHCVRSW